jgi:hypothetical protein
MMEDVFSELLLAKYGSTEKSIRKEQWAKSSCANLSTTPPQHFV